MSSVHELVGFAYSGADISTFRKNAPLPNPHVLLGAFLHAFAAHPGRAKTTRIEAFARVARPGSGLPVFIEKMESFLDVALTVHTSHPKACGQRRRSQIRTPNSGALPFPGRFLFASSQGHRTQLGCGSKARLAPSEHLNPTTKIGSKMGGEFTPTTKIGSKMGGEFTPTTKIGSKMGGEFT